MNGKLISGLLGSALVASAAFWSGGGQADAADTIGLCAQTAEATSCTYYNANGIKSAFVSVDTPEGVLVVVNEVYDCESPISFTVPADLGPTHHWEVEACPPDVGVGGDDGIDGLKTRPQPPEPPRGVEVLKNPTAEPVLPDGETIVIGGLVSPR